MSQEPRYRYLDKECATIAQGIGSKSGEDVIGRALGVLQEDGVYAFLIYVLSLERKAGGSAAIAIMEGTTILLKGLGKLSESSITTDNVARVYAEICADLDSIYFVKEMLERTLVYARYNAKANAKPKKERRP